MIRRVLERRGRTAGPDLSGASRKRVSAAGRFARRSARHLAVHALSRRGIRSRANLLDRRPQRSGKSDACRGPSPARSLRHVRRLVSGDGRVQFGAAQRGSGPSSAPAMPISGNCRSGNALPKQTQNYVPIILALALVAKDPARYGVQVSPEKPPETEAVKLDHPIDLATGGRCHRAPILTTCGF